MKAVVFKHGLGNQLFQYSYFLHIKKQYPNEHIYGFFPKETLKAHNGLEIEKWFDVKLPRPSSLNYHLFHFIYYHIPGILSRFNKYKRLFINTDTVSNKDVFIYDGFWQDKQYVLENDRPKFRHDLTLSKENLHILNQIQKSNSVAIHIRRGDYMSERNLKRYGNICTQSYYEKAISRISDQVDSPKFFVFSDDADYVRNTFHLQNMIIVSCNQGENSFFDLFLMAHCKHMIIANSTFSCWAAYLNENNGHILCPYRWMNDIDSPVNLPEWEIILP